LLKDIRNFVTLADFTGEQLDALLQYARRQKETFKAGRLAPTLSRRTLAMIFEKPSLRTRVSFEAAMTQLGGHAINLDQQHIGLGKRESVEDAARVLGRMCDAIMARTFSQQAVETLAAHAGVPVINGLTDKLHPCQAMGDMLTILERFGKIQGLTVVFVGDGNNVARSLSMACAKLGANFILSCPAGYELEAQWLDACRAASDGRCEIRIENDPAKAVAEADVIYTDTWVSMGQEKEKQKRLQDFRPYQVNDNLLSAAKRDAVVMHCLPAYRGNEITDSVIDGPRSVVFEQAENRLHFQRALLEVLIVGPQPN